MAGLALLVSLSGTAYAVGGDGLVLGAKNKAAKTTSLSVKGAAVALKLSSKGGPAASFAGGPGQPPFIVGSSTLVPGLNADHVDGLDASAFRKTGDPVDATTLGGLGPNAFRKTSDPVDAATLDGLDSTSFLRSDTTAVTASVMRLAAQTSVTASGTVLTADYEFFDPSGMHAGSGSDLTAPKSGTYVVSAVVEWDPSGAGYRRASIVSVDSGAFATVAGPALPSPAYTSQSITGIEQLSAGQSVHVEVLQGSGGNLNVRLSRFQIVYVGP
jgi:hypothetical protein